MSNQDVSRSVSVLFQFCQCSVVFVLSETSDTSLTAAYVSTITIFKISFCIQRNMSETSWRNNSKGNNKAQMFVQINHCNTLKFELYSSKSENYIRHLVFVVK